MTLDDLLEEFEALAAGTDIEGSAAAGWEVFKAIACRPLEDVPDYAPVDELAFEVSSAIDGQPQGARLSISRAAQEHDDAGDYVETTVLALIYVFAGPSDSVGSKGCAVFGYGATYADTRPGESVEDFIDRVEASAVYRELVLGRAPSSSAVSFGPA